LIWDCLQFLRPELRGDVTSPLFIECQGRAQILQGVWLLGGLAIVVVAWLFRRTISRLARWAWGALKGLRPQWPVRRAIDGAAVVETAPAAPAAGEIAPQLRVALHPSSGKAPEIFLAVRNEGEADVFQASCRIFVCRNTNGERLGSYTMVWGDNGRREHLRLGQSGNLRVATFGYIEGPSVYPNRMAWLELVAYSTTPYKSVEPFDDTRWEAADDAALPVYGLEITIVSDKNGSSTTYYQLQPEGPHGPLELRMLKRDVLDELVAP